MHISFKVLTVGVLFAVPQVQAWWGQDLWDYLFGGDSDQPVAMT